MFVSPVIIPFITNRRVDSFATYTYSCRICPLEFVIVFVLTIKTPAEKCDDISIQIEQRARIGKIFARWNLAIAITSAYLR